MIIITTVPLYLVLSPKIGSDIAGWLVIIVAVPIGFVGFISIQGLNAERIIFYWKRNYINFAKPIVFKTEQELLQEKKSKKLKQSINNISKKELKNNQKLEKQKEKELKKERKKQREIARAKKKFGINQLNNTSSNFSLSEEEAQVLLKLAKQVVEKREDANIDESKIQDGTQENEKEA